MSVCTGACVLFILLLFTRARALKPARPPRERGCVQHESNSCLISLFMRSSSCLMLFKTPFFSCHLLLKHTFPWLSSLSYILSGFHSSNSSSVIKLMASKANQADMKRSQTFCPWSSPIKLENQDRRKKLRFCIDTF